MGSPYELAELYVRKGPPYWFVSKKHDAKYLGKKEGGAGGDFGWSRNMWYAKTNALFVAMWNTGKVEMEERAIDGNMVVRLIHEKEAAKDQAATAAAVAVTNQNTGKDSMSIEHVDKQSRKDLLIPDNLPEDLAELQRRVDPVLLKHPDLALGTTPEEVTVGIIKKSRFWPGFGPRSGISDVKRVLRALDLEICDELKHLIDGTFEKNELEEIARRNAKRASSQSKNTEERNWTGEPLHVASDDHPVSDTELDSDAEAEQLLARKYPELVDEAVCPICEKTISEQFLDCDCATMPNAEYEIWKHCKQCHKMLRVDNYRDRCEGLIRAENSPYWVLSETHPFCSCS